MWILYTIISLFLILSAFKDNMNIISKIIEFSKSIDLVQDRQLGAGCGDGRTSNLDSHFLFKVMM